MGHKESNQTNLSPKAFDSATLEFCSLLLTLATIQNGHIKGNLFSLNIPQICFVKFTQFPCHHRLHVTSNPCRLIFQCLATWALTNNFQVGGFLFTSNPPKGSKEVKFYIISGGFCGKKNVSKLFTGLGNPLLRMNNNNPLPINRQISNRKYINHFPQFIWLQYDDLLGYNFTQATIFKSLTSFTSSLNCNSSAANSLQPIFRFSSKLHKSCTSAAPNMLN